MPDADAGNMGIWTTWTFKQYRFGESGGSSLGVEGGVALDSFNGDETALLAMTYRGSAPMSSTIISVVNSASFVAGDLAPGGLVSVLGQDLANNAVSSDGLPLPTKLGGVEATINDVLAPILYVSRDRIDLQVPFGLSPGAGRIVIRVLGIVIANTAINVVAAAPGILTNNGRSIIANSDNALNTASNGAAVGSYVTVYFIGQGAVDTQVQSGSAAPLQPPARTLGDTTVTIGGIVSDVAFSGLIPGYVGLA